MAHGKEVEDEWEDATAIEQVLGKPDSLLKTQNLVN
jgi:hypothetical protein